MATSTPAWKDDDLSGKTLSTKAHDMRLMHLYSFIKPSDQVEIPGHAVQSGAPQPDYKDGRPAQYAAVIT